MPKKTELQQECYRMEIQSWEMGQNPIQANIKIQNVPEYI